MKKALLTLTALSMSVAVSACGMHSDGSHAWHDDHGERMDRMAEGFFSKMDKNGDGVVTKSEYKDYTSQWFKDADTNHDGKLTVDEVKAQFRREKAHMKKHHMHQDGQYTTDSGNPPPPPPPPPHED